MDTSPLPSHHHNIVLANLHFTLSTCSTMTHILIQALEPATLLLQQLIWLTVLDETTLVHDDDFVEVEDGFELMCDSDDGVGWEFLAQESLDLGVGLGVETVSSLVWPKSKASQVLMVMDLLARRFIDHEYTTSLPT